MDPICNGTDNAGIQAPARCVAQVQTVSSFLLGFSFASFVKIQASNFKIMEAIRHKSVDILKGYIRQAELFKNHAGAKFL